MKNVAYPTTRCNHHSAEALVPAVAHVSAPSALGEAPSTMNCYVDLPGYGKTQVTGRGRNGAEAAQNLKEGVDALRAVCAPAVAVPPTKSRLADVLACGLERAMAKGDMGRVIRLSQAAALVLGKAVHPAAMDGRYTVDSRTQEGVWWDVANTGSCGCPDYRNRATEENHFYCAHGLAVLMTIKLAEPTA